MEFKHFSHPHGLIFHQAPQGHETHCSGCNAPAPPGSSLYSCWQCKFFLHEQCFHASRSMNHHAHPPHPLTLVPYPTYPSGSFFCDSCSLTGTGFSYSCPSCEFDLHVHCAYMPVTASHDPYPSFPNPNIYSFPQETPSSFGPQFDYKHQAATVHDQFGVNTNFPNPQYSTFPNELPVHGMNAQMGFPFEEFPSVAHNKPINAPYEFPSVTHNKPTNAPYAGKNRPVPETEAQESVVNGPEPHYYVPNQELPKNSSGQTGLPTVEQSPSNPSELPYTKHFSHQHALQFSEDLKEEDYILCSGCEEHLSGSACICTNPTCNFHLHKSCFELPRQLHHKSHPKHALTLLPTPPYEQHNEFTCNACHRTGTAFTYHCKDCKFDLHVKCATNLPETIKRYSHEHPLTLLYSTPCNKEKKEEYVYFRCEVCWGTVDDDCWVYYCEKCNYGADVHCAVAEGNEEEKEKGNEEEESGGKSELEVMMEAQQHMQRLKIQMEMSRQNAAFMTSIAHGLSSLV